MTQQPPRLDYQEVALYQWFGYLPWSAAFPGAPLLHAKGAASLTTHRETQRYHPNPTQRYHFNSGVLGQRHNPAWHSARVLSTRRRLKVGAPERV